MENNSDRDSTALHSWHGGALLLEILGGLVVGAAIASASSFITFLLLPFSVNSVGESVKPSTPALFLGIITYLCFLSTSFRQVHGLAIVLSDNEFQAEVGTRLTQGERVISFLSAVAVLAITGILLTIVTSQPNDPIRVLLDLLQRFGIYPATLILFFHFLTVVSYWTWDRVSRDNATAASAGTAGSRGLRWGAMSYREFSSNWERMAKISLGFLLVTGLSYFLWTFFLIDNAALQDPKSPLPRILSLFAIVGLALSTLGYSIADYLCNAHFYFRAHTLTTLQSQNSRNADRNSMNPRQIKLVFASMTLFLPVFFGLVWATNVSAPPEPRVTLQLKWLYNAGFTGDLVAEEHGWRVGKEIKPRIKVTVQAGGIGTDAIKVVTSGSAQFGVATGDQLLLAAEQGAPVVAIALAYQENPLAWIVKHDKNIRQPSDLRGRNVGLTFIDDEPLFRSMLRHTGLSDSDLNVVPVKFDPSPFLSGQVDAYPVFRNTQGVEISKNLEQHQTATNFISPAQVGIVSYSNLYFTTKKYLKAHRPVVEAFVKGVLEGWAYAQVDPKDAARIVAKYDSVNSLEIVEASVRETNKLVKPRPDTSIGLMTLQGWEQTQDVLLRAGELKTRVNLEHVFTTDFVT